MSSKYYHVTGPPAFGPEVPLRREFSDFANDKDVLNLYLLALDRIQKFDQSKLTSYFQIGGIHGMPYIPWDDVKGIADPEFGGYCTHGSVIFPTWHRPYVVLYEQVIWEEASLIAASYKDPALKNKYEDAARRLRQPYWDWAANSNLHPLLSTEQMVTIVNVNGESEKIRNPLISYKFNPVDPSFPGSFATWLQTLRYPTSSSPDAQSQPDRVQSVLNNNGAVLRANTYNLLAFIKNWEDMSNHKHSDSLESIHDSVHTYLGGAGHMAVVDMAGFDPIFYLHHANVDRILAMWQVLNKELWVVPGSSGNGSSTVPPNQTVDANTALTPFHVDDNSFWTSTNIRSTKSFGYTYAETKTDDVNTVIQAVKDLYGPVFASSAAHVAGMAQTKPSVTLSSNPGHGEPVHEAHSVPIPRYPSQYNDWYAEIVVSPFEFSTSGYVHIFLCEVVPSGDWLFAPERVGDIGIFRNISGKCANCNDREAAGEKVSGRVPLTDALLKKGKDINNVEGIKEYLTTHLQWRCALVDGTEVLLENVPSLQVKLLSALCQRAETRDGFEGFPRRRTPEVHHSVTHGKVGGYITEGN